MEADRKKNLPNWHVLPFGGGLIHPVVLRGENDKFKPTDCYDNSYHRQFESEALRVSDWGGCVPFSYVGPNALQPRAGDSLVVNESSGARVVAGQKL